MAEDFSKSNSRCEEKRSSDKVSESAHLQLLLEINNILASTLETHEVLAAISHQLRRLMRHRYSRVLLYDACSGGLNIHMLDFPKGKGVVREGLLIPLQNTAEGWVYTRRKPLIVDFLTTSQYPAEITERLLREGVRSMCLTPLICHDRILGVLSIGSEHERAFNEDDLCLLNEVAKPVSIHIENSLNFENISDLKERLTKERLYLQKHTSESGVGENMVGSSPALLHVLERVNTVARFDSSVLITGETGTGKELVARAIHKLSLRRDHPFIKVDCASIPVGLLESELFGHEKGSYTNAYTDRVGRLEMADQGTIFLDEIGDLPLELQPKLLRALQDHEFDRLGASKSVRVNVRLVAATNLDLPRLVDQGRFRQDLYYRLNVFPIVVPPLHERRKDIPLLARHFVQKFGRKMNKQIESVSAGAMDYLLNSAWPGNVRELENAIERAVIVSQGPILELAALDSKDGVPGNGHLRPRGNARGGNDPLTERETILRALEESNWVVGTSSGAAAKLGIKRTTLHARMKKLGICRHGDKIA